MKKEKEFNGEGKRFAYHGVNHQAMNQADRNLDEHPKKEELTGSDFKGEADSYLEFLQSFEDVEKGQRSEISEILSALKHKSSNIVRETTNWIRQNNRIITISGLMIVCVSVMFISSFYIVNTLRDFSKPKEKTETPVIIITLTPTSSPSSTLTKTIPPSLTVVPSSTVTTIPTLYGCANVGQLRIRLGPGTNYPVVGGLVFGDCLLFDGRTEDSEWLRLFNYEVSGWVSTQYIKLEGDVMTLAVILEEDIQTPLP